MSTLQLIIDKSPNTSLYLLDIKCSCCDTITRAADIVFGHEKDIYTDDNVANIFVCKGCRKKQPYTSEYIVKANRAGNIADHIIETYPHKDNRNPKTNLWINTFTKKMVFVNDSQPTFSNVQNKLYIPTADHNEFIELKYQLSYELNKEKDVPTVVQRILKQWKAIHPFLLLPDEITQPGALFDVCELAVEKTTSRLTAERTFVGSKLKRKAYFLDKEHVHLKSSSTVFNESVKVELNAICTMLFHGDKKLHLYQIVNANNPIFIGKYVEIKWLEEYDTFEPLTIFSEKPKYI